MAGLSARAISRGSIGALLIVGLPLALPGCSRLRRRGRPRRRGHRRRRRRPGRALPRRARAHRRRRPPRSTTPRAPPVSGDASLRGGRRDGHAARAGPPRGFRRPTTLPPPLRTPRRSMRPRRLFTPRTPERRPSSSLPSPTRLRPWEYRRRAPDIGSTRTSPTGLSSCNGSTSSTRPEVGRTQRRSSPGSSCFTAGDGRTTDRRRSRQVCRASSIASSSTASSSAMSSIGWPTARRTAPRRPRPTRMRSSPPNGSGITWTTTMWTGPDTWSRARRREASSRSWWEWRPRRRISGPPARPTTRSRRSSTGTGLPT